MGYSSRLLEVKTQFKYLFQHIAIPDNIVTIYNYLGAITIYKLI